jgi:hypothetical protein
MEPDIEAPAATARSPSQTVKDHFWPIVLVGASLFTLVGLAFLRLAWSRHAAGHDFQTDLLINLSAGFVGMALGAIGAAMIGVYLAKNKLRQLSAPLLRLIQRLRIENTIGKHAARCSVVFAVSALSEKNVSIDGGPTRPDGACPVCALDVDRTLTRCQECGLPTEVWNDRYLLQTHEEDLRNSGAKA